MRKAIFVTAICAGLAGGAVPQTKTKTTKTAVKKRAVKGKPGAAALKVPPRQLSPSPERTREIQEALIAKGYLQGPASGAWNPETSDAMRKFQEKEKLSPTGKISAKTLIELGLGPKDESVPNTGRNP